jgi:signal transduction histidine kinase
MRIPWATFLVWLVPVIGQIQLKAADGSSAMVYTNALAVHRLSREESALAHPVRLKGVVTYSDPQWSLLFVRDDTAGVFLSLTGGTYPTNKELVEIMGRTADGGFLPLVDGATWRHAGLGSMPEPRRIRQPDRFGAEIDCEWSEFVGVVRRVTLNPDQSHLQLEVMDQGWRARVFLRVPSGDDTTALTNLINARISAVGVGGIDYDSQGGLNLKLFVPGRACMRVLDQPTADPFLQPCWSLATVRASSGTNTPAYRIHVRGIVTFLSPTGEIVMQEGSSAVRVLTAETNQFKLGDALDAVGFVGPGVFSPMIEDAVIHAATAEIHADPVSVSPATVLWSDYDARLVRVTGLLQSREITGENHILTLLQDGILFGVSLQRSIDAREWTALKKGDRVAVTGICAIQGGQRGAPQSFQVQLRSSSGAVLQPAVHVFPAWQVLTIVAVGATAWGLAVLWGIALRRRVREQTSELASSLSLLNATIESTADGILVIDTNGVVSSRNTKFTQMWRLPSEIANSKDDRLLLNFVSAQLKDGQAFLSRVREVYANSEAESFDTLEFKDGRIFERFSQPQRLEGKCVGRVWCFRDVTQRKQGESELDRAHKQLVDASRKVGMAEVATGVLHNVGNVLNSVNVSATLINDRLHQSRIHSFAQASALIEERIGDLATFFTQDPKGKKLPSYLKALSHALIQEHRSVQAEVESLRKNVEHIKVIVAMQQGYARVGGALEESDPKDVMEDAIQIDCVGYEQEQIQLIREYQAVPRVSVDRHKVLQILVNLLSNARHALEHTAKGERQVILSIFPDGADRVCFRVRDNGSGIKPHNLNRIFNQGFTTRKNGHGFGLHSGANAAKEMHGSLSVKSDGPGKGASFTLELPVTKIVRTHSTPKKSA